jgi:hypothetical protein
MRQCCSPPLLSEAAWLPVGAASVSSLRIWAPEAKSGPKGNKGTVQNLGCNHLAGALCLQSATCDTLPK